MCGGLLTMVRKIKIPMIIVLLLSALLLIAFLYHHHSSRYGPYGPFYGIKISEVNQVIMYARTGEQKELGQEEIAQLIPILSQIQLDRKKTDPIFYDSNGYVNRDGAELLLFCVFMGGGREYTIGVSNPYYIVDGILWYSFDPDASRICQEISDIYWAWYPQFFPKTK